MGSTFIYKEGDIKRENLQLVSDDRHKQISILEAKIARLVKENDRLKHQLKQEMPGAV